MGIELEAGKTAPDFELLDQNRNVVRLDDFRGLKLLVYFYPKADTPGCTIQACSIRDSLVDLTAANVAAVGISPDAPKSQLNFAEKYDLGFPLLADEDHKVAEAYGVWMLKSRDPLKHGIRRSAFLINENGIVLQVWYGINPEETVSKTVQSLREEV